MALLAFLESVDTILLGRKTYELFVDFWPTATTDKEIIAGLAGMKPPPSLLCRIKFFVIVAGLVPCSKPSEP